MKLDGRRESSNVDDRRRMGGGAKAGGLGIGTILIAVVIYLTSGWEGATNYLMNEISNPQTQIVEPTNRKFTELEEQLAIKSSKVLGSTEDIWNKIFQEQGWGEYKKPIMVLYTDIVRTKCGTGSAQMGPFYCSGDENLYIDLSFFTTMKRQLGADGDFAYAYVIAHEVGHHVEYLTGTLQQAHQQMQHLSQAEANKVSVRLELLADFYAGVWAYHENKTFASLEDGDIEEAIDCALKIGDDYLQKKAQGYTVPESFNHGTSKQRMKWFKLGLETGDVRLGTTFQCTDAEL